MDELNSRLVTVMSKTSINRKVKKFRNCLGAKPKLRVKDNLYNNINEDETLFSRARYCRQI